MPKVPGSQRYRAEQQTRLAGALREKEWLPLTEAAPQLFKHPRTLKAWATRGVIGKPVCVAGQWWVHWPRVCAYVWHLEPQLAIALNLPQCSRCVVCNEICRLGRETCANCSVLKPRGKR